MEESRTIYLNKIIIFTTNILIIYIKPGYTSQDCPKSGHREKSNRNKRLHRFKCKNCDYTSNDDRAAVFNTRDRGVIFQHIQETRGHRQQS
ncbi:MAG: zinc ribbon domain-containing protein [Promethearchaeota archaeon]